jgi:hypothetical protein
VDQIEIERGADFGNCWRNFVGMNEIESLLSEAKREIVSLRRQNEILRAKVQVLDMLSMLVHRHEPANLECMSVDIVWELEKKIQDLSDLGSAAK